MQPKFATSSSFWGSELWVNTRTRMFSGLPKTESTFRMSCLYCLGEYSTRFSFYLRKSCLVSLNTSKMFLYTTVCLPLGYGISFLSASILTSLLCAKLSQGPIVTDPDLYCCNISVQLCQIFFYFNHFFRWWYPLFTALLWFLMVISA